MKSILVAVTCLFSIAASLVVNLDNNNFYNYVGQDRPVLVKFYAPWCGHCQHMAPAYDRLGEYFHNSDRVVIAQIDADKYGEFRDKFGVYGYPTLKWFNAGSVQTEDVRVGRSFEKMKDFVEHKIGYKPEKMYEKAQPKTGIVELDDTNFDRIVQDQSKLVLVDFYAPWCGHCQDLKPTYDRLADHFASNRSVVIAVINGDESPKSSTNISGFPTILLYPSGKEKQNVVVYEGNRSLNDLIAFVDQYYSENTVDAEETTSTRTETVFKANGSYKKAMKISNFLYISLYLAIMVGL